MTDRTGSFYREWTLDQAAERFFGLDDSEDEFAKPSQHVHNRRLTRNEAAARIVHPSPGTAISLLRMLGISEQAGTGSRIHLAAAQKHQLYTFLDALNFTLRSDHVSLLAAIREHFDQTTCVDLLARLVVTAWPWYAQEDDFRLGMQQSVRLWLGSASALEGWRRWGAGEAAAVVDQRQRHLNLRTWPTHDELFPLSDDDAPSDMSAEVGMSGQVRSGASQDDTLRTTGGVSFLPPATRQMEQVPSPSKPLLFCSSAQRQGTPFSTSASYSNASSALRFAETTPNAPPMPQQTSSGNVSTSGTPAAFSLSGIIAADKARAARRNE